MVKFQCNEYFTRFRVIRALQALQTKKDSLPMKKHCNLPL